MYDAEPEVRHIRS